MTGASEDAVSGWESPIRPQRFRVYLDAGFGRETEEIGHCVFEGGGKCACGLSADEEFNFLSGNLMLKCQVGEV